jgi:MoxR-like ATPase
MSEVSTATGFVDGRVYKVEQYGSTLKLINKDGETVGTRGSGTITRQRAFEKGNALQEYINATGKITFRQVPIEKFNILNKDKATMVDSNQLTEDEIKKFIHEISPSLKPERLLISELKWKYLVRSAMRGENIMMTGPTGCGKTQTARSLVEALDRPDYYFNLGATQDPRATLIGNTHFKAGDQGGTYFDSSLFVKAIQTEGAIILLDELTRAHPDAWNILMTVLDPGQRYLRLDEQDGAPTISVAKGVTFIATANIGSEYTSTRVLDRALLDRFTIIEQDVLTDKQEFKLLKMIYPEVRDKVLTAIAETAHQTRLESRAGDTLTEMISTRASVAMAGLVNDGFNFLEAAEIGILPFFSTDGGTDSERTFVLQILQKFDLRTDEELEAERLAEEARRKKEEEVRSAAFTMGGDDEAPADEDNELIF